MPARYWPVPAKFVPKIPKAGEQQTAAEGKEEAKKSNFPLALLEQVLASTKAQKGAPSRADVRMSQP